MNHNLNGYKYTLFGFTIEEYQVIKERFYDESTTLRVNDYNIIEKSNIISKGTIPERYPYNNKKIIPQTSFRVLGSDRSKNLFVTSYFCYTLNGFGDPSLIIHEDLESSWKCLVRSLVGCSKLLLIKERIEDEANVSA